MYGSLREFSELGDEYEDLNKGIVCFKQPTYCISIFKLSVLISKFLCEAVEDLLHLPRFRLGPLCYCITM